MAETTTLYVNILPDSIAYPLDSANMPQLAVYNAPYNEGDCPLWVLILQKDTALNRWEAPTPNDDAYYATIDSRYGVTVTDWDADVFTEDNSYEIRIYDSGIPVSEIV